VVLAGGVCALSASDNPIGKKINVENFTCPPEASM
jgi:hypothetical protein